MKGKLPRLCLFSQKEGVDSSGHIVFGGCDTVELAASFGTPLYVFDEITLRNKCLEYRHEFSKRYPDTQVIYAAKAFISPTLVSILREEGLGLDVISEGEISFARSAAFPSERIYFHGNNKIQEEPR